MGFVGGHWYLILIILVIVLIIWGPGKLPDVGAGMGRAIREFRKASSETRDTFMNATTEHSAHTASTPASQTTVPQSPVPPPPVTAPPAPPPAPEHQHSQAPPHTPVSG
jgi:sec-independent protein translocase protein TatA